MESRVPWNGVQYQRIEVRVETDRSHSNISFFGLREVFSTTSGVDPNPGQKDAFLIDTVVIMTETVQRSFHSDLEPFAATDRSSKK